MLVSSAFLSLLPLSGLKQGFLVEQITFRVYLSVLYIISCSTHTEKISPASQSPALKSASAEGFQCSWQKHVLSGQQCRRLPYFSHCSSRNVLLVLLHLIIKICVTCKHPSNVPECTNPETGKSVALEISGLPKSGSKTGVEPHYQPLSLICKSC